MAGMIKKKISNPVMVTKAISWRSIQINKVKLRKIGGRISEQSI